MKYVEIDEQLCNGCVVCLKECPTKAIRIRKGKAKIEGVCINCARCVRVCPNKAITPVIYDKLERDKKYIVCPSVVLYSQFGEDTSPDQILLGLKKMNLGYVKDIAYINEMLSYAIQLYIMEKRKEPDPPFPIISNSCPVVLRLIEYRFPSLIPHILPLATAEEIFVREMKKRISQKEGIPAENIDVLYIMQCPALMLYLCEKQTNDRLIGINEIYKELKESISSLKNEGKEIYHSSGIGILWGMSGGEIISLKAKAISVSGICDTINSLEKIEMGLMKDIEYIELKICPEGCIGGLFTVEDKYLVKRWLQKRLWTSDSKTKIDFSFIEKLYKNGWFKSDRTYLPLRTHLSELSVSERLERERKIREILSKLPNIECGLCGAPDCRTFAEDVIDGRASMKDCHWFQLQEKEDED